MSVLRLAWAFSCAARCSSLRSWKVIAVGGGGVVAVVALGAYGVHRHLGGAKTAEARNELARLGAAAAAAYARDGRICPSATSRVPAKMRADCTGAITGIYSSTTADWRIDEPRHAGFACIGFDIPGPQYYQYEYAATADGFVARARTCVPDLASYGAFELRGTVRDGRVRFGDVTAIPNE